MVSLKVKGFRIDRRLDEHVREFSLHGWDGCVDVLYR